MAASFQFGPRLRKALVRNKPPSMLEWACRAIVVPDGPHKGQPFDPDVQPFARLFLSEVDSGKWDRIVATGPTQTGKSLICYVICVLYHLFALGETVVAGVPTLDMADDKWREDFLPVIEASPSLRALLPLKGAGSRAGRVRVRVKFRNGATLRFMSGGGHDKTRAGFTTRVLAVTEVDGLDKSGATSREADKLKQMEGRQRAHLATGTRTYLECTVTTEKGRIWQEYKAGSESRIIRPCPHCKAWVSPGRECLVGWHEAETEIDARQGAAWSCPECGEFWTEAERHAANRKSRLLHRGQEVTQEGEIVGGAPGTRTLGFRWTAVDNHFASAADVAADEWNAAREHDRENAEKELRQFVHCIPYEPPEVELTPLRIDAISKRTGNTGKGVIPGEADFVTLGIDLRKRELHYVLVAWWGNAMGRIADYGVLPVHGDHLGAELGVLTALRDFRDQVERGWKFNDRVRAPDQVWIDSGWLTNTVYQFVLESNQERYRPMIGRGVGVYNSHKYTKPKERNEKTRFIGDEYHISWLQDSRIKLCEVNCDHWKSWLHERISCPKESAGAVTLFDAPAREHFAFASHMTSEKRIEEFDPGKGLQLRWVKESGQNHWFDAAYIACAAAHFVGVRLTGVFAKRDEPAPTARQLAARAGRLR